MALEDPQRRFFSTAQVASYCSVSTDGVLRWIRTGKLEAFTTPGGHYRIRAEDFRDFLDRFGIPIDESYFRPEGPQRTVLLIGTEPEPARAIVEAIAGLDGSVELLRADDGYEAALQVGRHIPTVIVIDPAALVAEGARLCRTFRQDELAARIPVLGLTPPSTRTARREVERTGADCCLVVPATLRRIRASLARLVDLDVVEPEDGPGRPAAP